MIKFFLIAFCSLLIIAHCEIKYFSDTEKVFDLKPIDGGYQLEVLLEKEHSSKKHFEGEKVKMLLALYSSSSFIAKDCKGFTSANLATLKMEPKEKTTLIGEVDVNYTSFSSKGFLTVGEIKIDDNHWALKYPNNIIVGTSCSSELTYDYKDTVGVLGMGSSNASARNYLSKDEEFAILFNKPEKKVHMIFNPDLNKGRRKVLNTLNNTNNDFHLEGDAFIIVNKNEELEKGKSLIFDVNYPYIGVPAKTFEKIIIELVKNGLVKGETDKDGTHFTFDGPLTALPLVSFKIALNKVTLEPKDYIPEDAIKDGHVIKDHKFILNIRPTSGLEHGKVNKPFVEEDRFIIIGSGYMSNYYTVFDESMNSIILCAPEAGESTPEEKVVDDKGGYKWEDGHFWRWFFLVVVILLVVVGFFMWRRRKAQQYAEQYQAINVDSHPLIDNRNN